MLVLILSHTLALEDGHLPTLRLLLKSGLGCWIGSLLNHMNGASPD